MSQSQLFAGSLIAAFILYLGLTGKLKAYWTILTGGGTGSQTSGASGPIDPSIIAHGGTSPAIPGSTSTGGFAPGSTSGNPNPGLFGGSNTPGALTGNPSTGFGFFPALGTILNPFTGKPIFGPSVTGVPQ